MPANQPEISVIIPVYNTEKYLRKSLESVLAQTFKPLEILCINDGSTDSSLGILKEFAAKDERIKIIDKPNSGYGASVNLGIEKSSGKFIAIFEPDDLLDKHIYEILYKKAAETNLPVVKCNFYNMWEDKKLYKKSKLFSKCAKKEISNPAENLKLFTSHASVWAGIYKKSFLTENNIKFLETPGASFQDMSFTFKVLASAGQIALIDKPLIYYRQDNAAASVKNPQKVFCVCDEYDELTKFLEQNPDKKELFNTQKLINQYNAYMWNLTRIDTELRKSFADRFSGDFKVFYDKNEITDDFFKSVSKENFMLLVNTPEKFYEKFKNYTGKKQIHFLDKIKLLIKKRGK